MPITQLVRLKKGPEDPYGVEFDPTTDRRLTEAELARWGEHFADSVLRTTHRGLVLETRERNGYDDSDFYALVWNPETRAVETVEYGSTRYWTYLNTATADASLETLTGVEEWLAEQYDKQVERMAAVEATEIKVGIEVEVTKAVTRGKNKVAKGMRGTVVWRGEDTYNTSRWSAFQKYRVGIEIPEADGDRRVFLSEDNVTRVGAPVFDEDNPFPPGASPYAGYIAEGVRRLKAKAAPPTTVLVYADQD